MTKPTRDPVVARVRIAAALDIVFPYFTDPDLVMTWLAEKADLEPRPGGLFSIDVDGGKARGFYVDVDPPHRVVFTWGIPGDDELPAGRHPPLGHQHRFGAAVAGRNLGTRRRPDLCPGRRRDVLG